MCTFLKNTANVCCLISTECPELKDPVNGKKSCQKVAGKNSCAMTCDEGHSFNAETITRYVCGPDTEWKWNGMMDMSIPVC